MKITSYILAGTTLAVTMALAGGSVMADDPVKDIVYGESVHIEITASEGRVYYTYRFIPKAEGKYTITVDDYDEDIDDVLVFISDPQLSEEIDFIDYILPEEYGSLSMEVNLEKGKAYAIIATKDGVTTSTDYSFSINGYKGEGNPLSTGWWQNENGWLYNDEDGNMVFSDWAKIGGCWYFFDNTGYMQTGFFYYGGNNYYLRNNGAMATGWMKIEDKWYYFDEHGKMATGWKKISGKWYCFENTGEMKCNEKYYENNKWYYFNPSGEMVTGWYHVPNGANFNWFYFNADGSAATGWKKVGGAWYYFSNYGIMQTGWLVQDDNLYYLQDSGAMTTGWFHEINMYWYYFTEDGSAAKGWKQISGKWYLFNTGSGKMVTGWHYVYENGKQTSYYLKDSGEMAQGWYKIKNDWYYFEPSGVMVTGTKVIGGKTYEFYDSGICKNP